MDDLVDTSWTCHYTSTNSASYRKLFSSATAEDRLAHYFGRLQHYLTAQKPQYVDDLNDKDEKLGSLRECRYNISKLASFDGHSNHHQHATTTTTTTDPSRLIRLQLIYQHTTFTFILYTAHLILSKAPSSQTKSITNYLAETFTITIDPLKIPSTLLCSSLQTYISTLNPSSTSNDGLAIESRAALLKTAIGTLKITISFSGPVAPHLRTIDLNVPYDTVETLTSATRADRGFMTVLAEHLHLQTGVRLPLTSTPDESEGVNGRAGSVESESSADAPLRLSKIVTAAFAVSVEGRLRFAEKAIDSALNQEDVVIRANLALLSAIVEEARRRGTVEDE